MKKHQSYWVTVEDRSQSNCSSGGCLPHLATHWQKCIQTVHVLRMRSWCSMVECLLIVRRVVRSIPHGGPIELFPIPARDILYALSHRQGSTYTQTEAQEIAQWVHHEGSIRRPIAPWTDALKWSYISFQNTTDYKQIFIKFFISIIHWNYQCKSSLLL